MIGRTEFETETPNDLRSVPLSDGCGRMVMRALAFAMNEEHSCGWALGSLLLSTRSSR